MNPLTAEQKELISEKSKVFPAQTQIAIGLIENGEATFFGVKRENDSTIEVKNSQSVFEVGSISKVITSTLLANLLVSEKVKLDDEINDYLPFRLKDGTKITFKQLANHTSGLPRLPANLDLEAVDPANPYRDYGEKKLITYLSEQMELGSEPGEKYEYSNLGGGLLGYILTEIEGKSYEELLQSMICKPYKMIHSTTDRDLIKERLVIGLDSEGKETANWDMAVLMGAGGVLSTVEDLTKFAFAQFDTTDQALALTRIPNFEANDIVHLALGWAIIKTESGEKWLWHNGGTGGYSSSLIINIRTKNATVVLSNVSGFSKDSGQVGAIGSELMKTLDGE